MNVRYSLAAREICLSASGPISVIVILAANDRSSNLLARSSLNLCLAKTFGLSDGLIPDGREAALERARYAQVRAKLEFFARAFCSFRDCISGFERRHSSLDHGQELVPHPDVSARVLTQCLWQLMTVTECRLV